MYDPKPLSASELNLSLPLHISRFLKQLPKQLPLYSTSGHIESKPPSNLRVNESDLIHYLQGIYEALSY